MSLAMKSRVHGERNNNPDVAKTLHELGKVYLKKGKMNEAEEHCRSRKMLTIRVWQVLFMQKRTFPLRRVSKMRRKCSVARV